MKKRIHELNINILRSRNRIIHRINPKGSIYGAGSELKDDLHQIASSSDTSAHAVVSLKRNELNHRRARSGCPHTLPLETEHRTLQDKTGGKSRGAGCLKRHVSGAPLTTIPIPVDMLDVHPAAIALDRHAPRGAMLLFHYCKCSYQQGLHRSGGAILSVAESRIALRLRRNSDVMALLRLWDDSDPLFSFTEIGKDRVRCIWLYLASWTCHSLSRKGKDKDLGAQLAMLASRVAELLPFDSQVYAKLPTSVEAAIYDSQQQELLGNKEDLSSDEDSAEVNSGGGIQPISSPPHTTPTKSTHP